jgi:hypothetical protein
MLPAKRLPQGKEACEHSGVAHSDGDSISPRSTKEAREYLVRANRFALWQTREHKTIFLGVSLMGLNRFRRMMRLRNVMPRKDERVIKNSKPTNAKTNVLAFKPKAAKPAIDFALAQAA